MKTVCKKLFSLMLVAVLLVSAIPFQAFAATNDPVTVYFRIDEATTSFKYTEKAKIGHELGSLLPTKTVVQNEYDAMYSDGKVFTGKWVLVGGARDGVAITKNTDLSEDMKDDNGNIVLKAVFRYPDVTVTFKANGGTVDPAKKTYKMNDYFTDMPTPTYAGYIFAGWYTNVNDETTLVDSGTIVTGNTTLYAKWETGSLPVVFQKWDAANEEWVEVERRNPTTGKSLKDSGLSIPTYDEATYGTRAGYTVDEDYPWVDSNGKVFTKETVVKAVTYVRPNFKANTYKMTYDYECDELSNKTVEVKFGSKVTLEQPTRTNYVFRGWLIVQADYKELKTGDTYNYGDITLVAQWAPKGTVELRVYRDDTDGFKTYYYSGAIKDGELDLNNCDIKDYLKGSYKFDGWYDLNRWIDYLGTKDTKGVEVASNTITRLDSVETTTDNSSVTVIYGMVKGYKATSGNNATTNNNNVNTGNADPTNPQTGDTIMIAVSTMAMAAAALVVMFELKKRKMI